MSLKSKYSITIICVFLFVAMLSFYPLPIKANSETASLTEANFSLNQAFNNALTAEKLGANVTEILGKLRTAGELLSQAENSYNSGNIANVTALAENARFIADQVNNEALTLQTTAVNVSHNVFVQTLFFSSVGAVIFVAVLMFVWRRFKSSFLKRLLDLKPEGVRNSA